MLKSALKFGALAIIALLALGLAAQRRQERRARVREAVRAAVIPEPPASWTDAAKAELVRGMAVPDYVPAEDRDEFRACFVGKIVKAVPGGAREMQALSDARAKEIGYQGGFECAQEYSARLAGSKVWIPQFTPVFVHGCTRDAGEGMAAACACLGEQARKYFGSPAEFIEAMERSKRTPAAQRKWTKLIQACAEHAPQ